MTQNRYFVRLGLYFFGLMLLISFVATYFGLTLKHVDGILLIVLIRTLASKYIIDNGYQLSSNEYWSLFFGSLGIYSLYNMLLMIYLSFFIALTPKMIMFSVSLVLALGAFATFLGLWSAKRFARNSIPRSVPVKAYSVTDEGIANYLVDELSKHEIKAFIDKFHVEHDPLLSTAPSAEVNIMLGNASDLDKAKEVITSILEEDENREPWICPKCHEQSEGSFAICWNCGYEQ